MRSSSRHMTTLQHRCDFRSDCRIEASPCLCKLSISLSGWCKAGEPACQRKNSHISVHSATGFSSTGRTKLSTHWLASVQLVEQRCQLIGSQALSRLQALLSPLLRSRVMSSLGCSLTPIASSKRHSCSSFPALQQPRTDHFI